MQCCFSVCRIWRKMRSISPLLSNSFPNRKTCSTILCAKFIFLIKSTRNQALFNFRQKGLQAPQYVFYVMFCNDVEYAFYIGLFFFSLPPLELQSEKQGKGEEKKVSVSGCL